MSRCLVSGILVHICSVVSHIDNKAVKLLYMGGLVRGGGKAIQTRQEQGKGNISQKTTGRHSLYKSRLLKQVLNGN